MLGHGLVSLSTRIRCVAAAAVVSVAAMVSNSAPVEPRGAENPPKQLGLVERAQRHLAQVDVALSGPRDRITRLSIDQFTLFIGGKQVVPTAVDSLCPATPAEATSAGAIATPVAPTSYLFYFDQRNLSMAGRENGLELATAMIRELIRNGNRAAIVSSGKRLATFAGFTDRQETLIDALARIRADLAQWDTYAATESSREQDVARTKALSGAENACQLARMYQREELSRSDAALEVLMAALGRFADVDPPKVAIYFADALRNDPGRHYLAGAGGRCEQQTFDVELSFQKVHERASAFGVKLYAVQAEGLVSEDISSVRAAREIARRDAEGGLKNLTLETGGDAFLGGASVANMVRRLEADAACMYVLSFDPAPFPEDKPLSVRVEVATRGVRARTRTQIVVQSEAARRMATLLAAFTAPDSARDALAMQGGIVPLDVKNGKLRALVQESLPETSLGTREEWDLGMSLVSTGGVRDEASGRITVDRPGVKLVLESELEFPAGPFELSLVAMDSITGRVATGRIAGSWPGKVGAAQTTSIAVLQPTDGAFLRDGKVRRTGSLVIAENQAVRADRPTAFVTLVCRADKAQTKVRVSRALTGGSSSTFPAVDLALKDAACSQVRDVVPAGTLAAGPFTYTLSVEGAQASESRKFVVE